MNLLHSIRRRLTGQSVPPVAVRHAEHTMVFSADDEPARPNDFLLDLALRSVHRARGVSVDEVSRRMKSPPYYPDVWPGEHYKLLAGLTLELRPQVVVEIGTSTGLSALTLLRHLPLESRLVTFDLMPWRDFPDTVLTEAEFADGRLKQVLADLGVRETFDQHLDLLQSADLIFLDGPKDGSFEARVLGFLAAQPLPQNPVVVLDDIRVWNMLRTWREVRYPKLDLTSFGHWSGTGLIHWVTG